MIASNKPLVVNELSGDKELVRKPVLPRPTKRVISAPKRQVDIFAQREDIDIFVKFFSESESMIRAIKDKDRIAAKELYYTTINLGYDHMARATVQHFKWFEANPEKLSQRSWYVLLDGYVIAAELYYTYDKPAISDGVFDKIGRVLYERYSKEIERGFPEWRQYAREDFKPAAAHSIFKNNLHLGVAARIADAIRTGPTLAPPKPRPTLPRGIKSRWLE